MIENIETALSITGLTEYIKLLLEEDPQLIKVWVTGEVSSLYEHRVGLFFPLSDSFGQATIKCVVWNSQDSQKVNEGQELTIELPQGTIKVKVTEILS